MKSEDLFRFEGVFKTYNVRQGIFSRGQSFHALDDVTLSLRRGSFCGIVGESGSGKTTLARLMVGLIVADKGTIYYGQRMLGDWLRRNESEFRSRVQMVFQNPYMSLDPRWKVDAIMEEGVRNLPRHERRKRVEEALNNVQLKADYLKRGASELSGGERQRVAIARALAMKPDYLILDEPTSQLDVSVQAQIVELLRELRPQLAGGMALITHDIALVSSLVDEVVVFRAGKIVECGTRLQVITKPEQAYTRCLIDAVPKWPPGD
ncbi:MAG: ATP-binding cassette domain-containing protein [Candidatus Omnitrophota bacterium]|nr:ATP-binding cassette domain-containing protein [Candidatus Omnitrophota bacterium]